jgi:hypothetical protein
LTYADYQRLISPTWLQQPRGAAFQGAFGAELDVQKDRARQALVAGWPRATPTLTPSDALPYIGADRQLPALAAGEADATYAERLRMAWDAWVFAGSHGGLLNAASRAGFPMGTATGMNVVQKTKRYTYLSGSTVVYATHSGFLFDGLGPEIWNQFAIVFGADVAGLSAGTRTAQVLTDLVTLWKPAKARYMGCWVVVSGPIWGWPPTAAWGLGGRTWDTGSVRFIPPP